MWWRVQVLVIAACTVVADRAIGQWVATHMVPGQSVAVVRHLVAITYVLNSGAAFGILAHGDTLFIVVAIALLVGVAWVVIRRPQMHAGLRWGLGLLAGGAAGNLWDRVVAGQVIDYVNFHVWPVFNLADAAIVVGMALVFVEYWRREDRDVPGHAGESGTSPSNPSR